MTTDKQLAGLPPIISPRCRVVVLGSFPGVASLDAGHYYAHPHNLFWPIMADALGLPLTSLPFEQRYAALNGAGVGLWDVIASCQRTGSLDSNIRHSIPSQLEQISSLAPGVATLLLNGKKASQGARRVHWGKMTLVDLPSTSPANASVPRTKKLRQWRSAIQRALP